MALSFSFHRRFAEMKFGIKHGIVDITLDALGSAGWSITAANLRVNRIHNIVPPASKDGYLLEWDHVNAKLFARPPMGQAVTGIVTDDDSATTNGTDVLIAAREDGVLAYLNSTNAGNADSVFQIGATGPLVNIDDNDSPAGVVLYFDEDGDAGERLCCVSPTNADLFVPMSNGGFLRIKDNDDAASDGVAVHFDDDGATASERLLFVSPTDADGSFTNPSVFVGTELSSAVIRCQYWGG